MIQGNVAFEKSAVVGRRASITYSIISPTGQKVRIRLQFLAEAVILQSIEDLFDPVQRKKSIDFFEGDGFRLFAEIAGISTVNQLRIIRMLANNRLRPLR